MRAHSGVKMAFLASDRGIYDDALFTHVSVFLDGVSTISNDPTQFNGSPARPVPTLARPCFCCPPRLVLVLMLSNE
jgi:hypothetical protein